MPFRAVTGTELAALSDDESRYATRLVAVWNRWADEVYDRETTRRIVLGLADPADLPWAELSKAILQDDTLAGLLAGPRAAGYDSAIPDRVTKADARDVADHVAQMATPTGHITDNQAKAIRRIVNRMYEHDIGLEDAQRLIRQAGVGLHERYAVAVVNRYHRTHERLMKDHPNWRSSTYEKRARADAKRYAARLRRQRAESIARTEFTRALAEGREAAWIEGIEDGTLPPDARKTWVSIQTDPREICSTFHGTTVGVTEWFDASTPGPPLHVNCRCEVVLV